jgi:hypothetical protein
MDSVRALEPPHAKLAGKRTWGTRLMPFQTNHLIDYGLAIVAEEPITSDIVVVVRCRI